MEKRKSISKTKRFEVFKRDGFVCQYCGNFPPKVILEIDHIIPVSKGGKNTLTNLITACFECNRGKGATLTSIAPQSLKDQATEMAEKEAQILGYHRVFEKKEKRIKKEAFEVLEYLCFVDSYGNCDKGKVTSVKTFIKKLGFHETMEAAEIAFSKPYQRNLFKYFCGICWTKIKEKGIE